MKVKVLHRNPGLNRQSFGQPPVLGLHNQDPRLHPFQKEREYSRALVAVKLDKIFAKPFVASLDGHTDSISSISKGIIASSKYFTGSYNGDIRLWNIDTRECITSINAHEGQIRDLTYSHDEKWIFSCGSENCIKQWDVQKYCNQENTELYHSTLSKPSLRNSISPRNDEPNNSFYSKHPLHTLDHHASKPLFASGGDYIELWDYNRSFPFQSFDSSNNKILSVRFNQSQPHVFASTSANNQICIHDIRSNLIVRKVQLTARSNSLAWNPIQPVYFTVANEDFNLYTFDIRKLDVCLKSHKDFTNAVLSVDYSPTGLEFVAGSYDRTLRIFDCDSGRSRDVYHTQRMQQVLACRYTSDSKFVLSGSSDFCFRIWKTNASEPVGPISNKEKLALNYRKALKEKYKHLKEIKRIDMHKHVPALVKSNQRKHKIMTDAATQRKENLYNNTKSKSGSSKSQRKQPILKVLE